MKNVFVKKWNSSVELESSSDTTAAGITDPTTTRATGREGKSDGTHSESDDEIGSPKLQPNELADWYEALSAIHESLPSETHSRWKSEFESVIFDGNMLAPETPCCAGVLRGHGGLESRSSFLAIAGRVRSTVGLPFSLPRVESFSEFLQNALTGLGMESFVFWMGLGFQLVFEVAVVGNVTRFIPHFTGVVVGDVVRLYLTGSQTESENVPELAG